VARRTVPSWQTGLVEVGPDAYAYVQAGGGTGISNAGLIAGDEGALAVDALFMPPMTQAFLSAIKRVTQKPVRQLVNTHHHADHTMGNQFFLPTQIISHANCRREMLRVGLPTDRLAELVPQFADQLRQINLTLPDVTFDDRLVLHFGDRVIELIYLGPAHTIGDTVVYLPQDKLLFAGDIAFHYVTPLAFEGHVSGWIKVIDRISKLDIETVVPGHGPVGGKAELREMRDYLALLRREAKKCFQEGMNDWQAAKAIRLRWYGQWVDSQRVLANVRKLYQEFRREALAPLDAEQTFRDMQAFAADTADAPSGKGPA
jgi:cyclase